jgi:hypothetical protein
MKRRDVIRLLEEMRNFTDSVARQLIPESNNQKMLQRNFSMRILVSIAVLGFLTLPAPAQTLPEWAYRPPRRRRHSTTRAKTFAGQHQGIHPGPD